MGQGRGQRSGLGRGVVHSGCFGVPPAGPERSGAPGLIGVVFRHGFRLGGGEVSSPMWARICVMGSGSVRTSARKADVGWEEGP